MAAPATVSGEPRANYATGQLGRRRKAGIREPGDLPSFVVTHEHIGRGAPVGTRHRLSTESASGLWFVVTCHVAARPQLCLIYRDIRASRSALALLGFLIVYPARVSAADDDASAAPISLPPVVVTPTRLPTPESEVGSSITVITSEEIERKQERTLPDALKDVPGLNVVQTGGPGGQTSVFLRGANANQTKVFIDGIDATDPATGTFNFEHILTWDIDRVEIVRGPQSGLYGADAIGGVVNIITKTGSGPPQFGGSIEGGSFGTFNQNGGVRGSLDRFNYYLDFAHFHSSDTPVTPTDLLPLGRSAQGNAYDNKTLSSRFGIDLADNFDIGLVTRYIDTSLHFTGDDFLGPENLRSTEDDQQLFTRGTAHLVSFDGVFDQTVGLSYTKFNQRDFDPNPPNPEPSFFNGDRLKADWQGNLNLMPGQVLTLRAEHQRDEITNPIAEITDNAAMIQLQSGFGDRFFNAASVRYDQLRHVRWQNDLPHRPRPALSGDRFQAQGKRRDRLQGADPGGIVSELPVLQLLREPQPEARDQHRLRPGVRASASGETSPVRRDLFP